MTSVRLTGNLKLRISKLHEQSNINPLTQGLDELQRVVFIQGSWMDSEEEVWCGKGKRAPCGLERDILKGCRHEQNLPSFDGGEIKM